MADPHPPSDESAPPTPTPDSPRQPAEEIPWGQRFFDRPFLLLVLGVLIMAAFFTGWGLWEITSLPPAPLP
ncbi:MAG TPA: hypothetical protein VK858_16365 [Longimicrobiales bacterium]|nr:hypothetical protein [Longimicrobiales bacterium]